MNAFRMFEKLLRSSSVGVAAGVAVLILPTPEDVDPLWQIIQAPIGALLIVCSVGKALFDTFFYDRYGR